MKASKKERMSGTKKATKTQAVCQKLSRKEGKQFPGMV